MPQCSGSKYSGAEIAYPRGESSGSIKNFFAVGVVKVYGEIQFLASAGYILEMCAYCHISGISNKVCREMTIVF